MAFWENLSIHAYNSLSVDICPCSVQLYTCSWKAEHKRVPRNGTQKNQTKDEYSWGFFWSIHPALCDMKRNCFLSGLTSSPSAASLYCSYKERAPEVVAKMWFVCLVSIQSGTSSVQMCLWIILFFIPSNSVLNHLIFLKYLSRDQIMPFNRSLHFQHHFSP